MDSRDKELQDLQAINKRIKVTLSERERQIGVLTKTLRENEELLTGASAVRTSLSNERELTIQLNSQIETLKKLVENLNQENSDLKLYNVELQKRNVPLAVN